MKNKSLIFVFLVFLVVVSTFFSILQNKERPVVLADSSELSEYIRLLREADDIVKQHNPGYYVEPSGGGGFRVKINTLRGAVDIGSPSHPTKFAEKFGRNVFRLNGINNSLKELASRLRFLFAKIDPATGKKLTSMRWMNLIPKMGGAPAGWGFFICPFILGYNPLAELAKPVSKWINGGANLCSLPNSAENLVFLKYQFKQVEEELNKLSKEYKKQEGILLILKKDTGTYRNQQKIVESLYHLGGSLAEIKEYFKNEIAKEINSSRKEISCVKNDTVNNKLYSQEELDNIIKEIMEKTITEYELNEIDKLEQEILKLRTTLSNLKREEQHAKGQFAWAQDPDVKFEWQTRLAEIQKQIRAVELQIQIAQNQLQNLKDSIRFWE